MLQNRSCRDPRVSSARTKGTSFAVSSGVHRTRRLVKSRRVCRDRKQNISRGCVPPPLAMHPIHALVSDRCFPSIAFAFLRLYRDHKKAPSPIVTQSVPSEGLFIGLQEPVSPYTISRDAAGAHAHAMHVRARSFECIRVAWYTAVAEPDMRTRAAQGMAVVETSS